MGADGNDLHCGALRSSDRRDRRGRERRRRLGARRIRHETRRGCAPIGLVGLAAGHDVSVRERLRRLASGSRLRRNGHGRPGLGVDRSLAVPGAGARRHRLSRRLVVGARRTDAAVFQPGAEALRERKRRWHRGRHMARRHHRESCRSSGRHLGFERSPRDRGQQPDGDRPRCRSTQRGNITSLWARHDGGGWRVEVASRPVGGSWQLPATSLASTPNGAVQPVLAGNGAGDQVAAWRQTDGAHVRIAAAIRPSGGAWPGSAVFVSSSGVDASRRGW